MPTVPPQSNVVQMRPRLVGDTYMMMAAAEYHEAGLLFEQRAEPTKSALADGTMDAVGANSTDFTQRKR